MPRLLPLLAGSVVAADGAKLTAADYVDALARPRTQDTVVKKKVITGRRMRDKFLEEVVVSEVVRKLG